MKRVLLLALFIFGLAAYALYFELPSVFTNRYSEEKQSSPNYVNEGGILPNEPEPLYVSPISIDYLRGLTYNSPAPTIEQELSPGSNYKRYIASYISDGYKIYGLLTVPTSEVPEGGFPAIVFNHGYIPPIQYRTTEKYVAYVDYLARNGFVVFKIDMRGHGDSEGYPTGSYFSNGYTIDALNALSSLQKYDSINPNRIGMWGHSMSGNLVLRAMLVSSEVKAGVIWAGAVYSYEDFAKYRISDTSYSGRRRDDREEPDESQRVSENSSDVQNLRENPEDIDFNSDFWKSISLTSNLGYFEHPLQIHHSVDDSVVNVGYSRDLGTSMDAAGKGDLYTLYEYAGGGHNINSPYFEQAMQRTTDFFKENL